MKIAMLSDLFYPYQLGGAERQFYEIARRLAKKHEVHVYTVRIKNYPKEEIFENIHIHRLGLPHPNKRRSLISLMSYFISLRRIIGELDDFDIIHANQAAGIFSHFYKGNPPFVLTIHDLYLNDWKKYFPFPLSIAGQKLERLMIKGRYSKIITISEISRKKITEQGMKAPITVINNGIDLENIKKIRGKRRNGVIFIGRLVKYKNIDVLIGAMKKVQEKFPKKVLVIVGSGEEENALKELAAKLGVNAKFMGYVPEEEKIRAIKSAEVFVSMSSVEGFGISLLEAMASRTPVIAKRLECYKEFCNNKNSILIDEKNLAESIIHLLKNRGLRKRLSLNGIKTAKEFSWDRVAKKIEKVYHEALSFKSL